MQNFTATAGLQLTAGKPPGSDTQGRKHQYFHAEILLPYSRRDDECQSKALWKKASVSELGVSFQVITSIDDKSTGTATVCLDCSKTCDWATHDIPLGDLFPGLYAVCINPFE